MFQPICGCRGEFGTNVTPVFSILLVYYYNNLIFSYILIG
jgi:hypothetical protein